MLVFAGAPKVGKSDFLLSLLVRMCAGESFLGLKPPRPLRIFYLQSEVQSDYLRERIHNMHLSPEFLDRWGDNLYATPKLKMVLDDAGCRKVIRKVQKIFPNDMLDIIAIDPIRNVFDGGPESKGENDNNSMLFFLQKRAEKIRDAINPKAGIILVHHTKKILKQVLIEEPFQAFSGASSLRAYYNSGMIMYRPDEEFSERKVIFELRDGKTIPSFTVDKQDGQWIQLDPRNPRLIQKEYGAKHDAERIRKNNVIVQLIFDEAAKGRVYTPSQFANAFEGKAGLGGNRTIINRLGAQTTKGHIKFFRNPKAYGLNPAKRSKYGYLCVEDMQLSREGQNDDGEVTITTLSIKPTHYICPQSGALLPVENPDVWVYQEELAA